MASAEEKPFLNLVFTQPRTCSHLLLRILNLPAQSKTHKHPRDDGYFFMDTLCARFVEAIAGQGIASFKDNEVPEYYALLQRCIDNLRAWAKEVQSTGKGCFVKEHVCWTIDPAAESAFIESLQPGLVERPFDFGGANANRAALTGKRSPDNDTVIPDDLLKEFKPTILIRHPALAFSSLVRASTQKHVFNSPDGNNWELTFRWSKSVFDWYSAHMTDAEKKTAIEGVQFPIILDGDDISNPAVMARYAKAVGLDENALQWSWPVAGEKDLAHIPVPIQYMIGTISNSEGVIASKTSKGLDLAKEKEAWIQEFGQKLGSQLATMVDDAMPVYEWLKERRMTV